MDEEVFELVGEDIFDGNLADAVAVLYWILLLNGGKIVIPVDEEFWLANYPKDARLVLRKEGGQLVLAAEQKVWQSDTAGSFD
jgi:hypothetical protein